MFAVTWLPSCLASTAAACACSCCTAVAQQALRSSARAAWALLFTLSIVAAWLARDFGPALLKKLPVRSGGCCCLAPSAPSRRLALNSLFVGSLPCSCRLTPWQRSHLVPGVLCGNLHLRPSFTAVDCAALCGRPPR